LLRLWEWLTLIPKETPFPQYKHLAIVMIIPFVIYQAHKPSTDSALNNNRTMCEMQVKNQETANNPGNPAKIIANSLKTLQIPMDLYTLRRG